MLKNIENKYKRNTWTVISYDFVANPIHILLKFQQKVDQSLYKQSDFTGESYHVTVIQVNRFKYYSLWFHHLVFCFFPLDLPSVLVNPPLLWNWIAHALKGKWRLDRVGDTGLIKYVIFTLFCSLMIFN